MKYFFRYIFIGIVLSMANIAWAGNVVIEARLDSATLLMGKTTALHVSISQDQGTRGVLTLDEQDTICAAVEIAQRLKADTSDIGNKRFEIKRDIILQSFDSGTYLLPPLKYIVANDTFKTQPLTLKVIPVKVDSLANIHDYKGVEVIPFSIADWLSTFALFQHLKRFWWLYLLLIAAIVAGVKYYRGREKAKEERAKEPELPPYDEAMSRLLSLKERQLWQSGQEKAYFTVLTDILRNYIDRRFSINAMEMTSAQIIETLKRNEETRAVNEQLNRILEVADFVKFANVRPLPDDNELAMQRALNFVNETKPEEKPQEEADGKADNKQNSKEESK